MELKQIETIADLAENFRRFQADAKYHRDRTAKIFCKTRFWVCDANSGAFGPSKFLGFKGMDFWLYERAKAGDTTGQRFQGTITRKAIEAVLDAPFRKRDSLPEECTTWGKLILGPHAFGNANPAKWKFLEIAIPGRELNSDYPDEVIYPEKFYEGASKLVTVNRYERNPLARAACIAYYGAKCQVCDMDFQSQYGLVGAGFIHVHHVKPLADIREGYEVDTIRDLRPVCPNCHAMIHRPTRRLDVSKLRAMLLATKLS